MMKLITQAMQAYGAIPGPNNSTAIMLAEIGVLAAPASKATSPIAEKVEGLSPKSFANKLPDVAPIKNIGVTMPPLPPKLRVIAVKIIFRINAYQTISSPSRQEFIVSVPKPRNWGEKIRVKKMRTKPPRIAFKGFQT